MTKIQKITDLGGSKSGKTQKLFSLPVYFADSCMTVNLEHLGECTNKRAHSCLCEMEKTDLKILGNFLHKIHHFKKSENIFSKWKSNDSHLKFKGDKLKQIKHLYVTPSFRLHGFVENNIFHLVAIDTTHEDGKN